MYIIKMKLLACLSCSYGALVLLTLNNGAYGVPLFREYALYDFDSGEDPGLAFSDCVDSEDCLKLLTGNGSKVDGIIIDFSRKRNCTTLVSSDKNAMSNDVPVLNQSTDRNPNNMYNETYITDTNDEFNKVLESEINGLVSSDDFIDDTEKLISEESGGNVGVSVVDDVQYEDVPGILIIYVINDDGEAHNIKVDNAVQVTSDEITLNFNRAVQALADFINDDKISDDDMEWIDGTESEEPRRTVEDGYIFYDMGKFFISCFMC
jgi:hypothetical protein